jgi:hypothetical protein
MRSQLIENKHQRLILIANYIMFFRFSAFLAGLAALWAFSGAPSYATVLKVKRQL